MLIVKESELKFNRFIIKKSQFFTHHSGDENGTVYTSGIPLFIDFDIQSNTEDENLLKISIGVDGNTQLQRITGYVFSVEADGYYSFMSRNKEGINEDMKNTYLIYSALPMMISSIRMYLMNITSMSEFGQYILPSVDLRDLINQWYEKNTWYK